MTTRDAFSFFGPRTASATYEVTEEVGQFVFELDRVSNSATLRDATPDDVPRVVGDWAGALRRANMLKGYRRAADALGDVVRRANPLLDAQMFALVRTWLATHGGVAAAQAVAQRGVLRDLIKMFSVPDAYTLDFTHDITLDSEGVLWLHRRRTRGVVTLDVAREGAYVGRMVERKAVGNSREGCEYNGVVRATLRSPEHTHELLVFGEIDAVAGTGMACTTLGGECERGGVEVKSFSERTRDRALRDTFFQCDLVATPHVLAVLKYGKMDNAVRINTDKSRMWTCDELRGKLFNEMEVGRTYDRLARALAWIRSECEAGGAGSYRLTYRKKARSKASKAQVTLSKK